MKRYPKLLQTDARGQLVIPKEVRRELGITEGTGFWAFVIEKEGIFLKKIDPATLAEQPGIKELKDKASAIPIAKANAEKSEARYTKQKKGVFDDV